MNTHSTPSRTSHLQYLRVLPFPPLRTLSFIPHPPSFPLHPLTIYRRLVHLPPQSTLSAKLIPLLPPPQQNTVTLSHCQMKMVSVFASSGTYLPHPLPLLVLRLPVLKSPQIISVVVLYSTKSGRHPLFCQTSLPLTLKLTAHP